MCYSTVDLGFQSEIVRWISAVCFQIPLQSGDTCMQWKQRFFSIFISRYMFSRRTCASASGSRARDRWESPKPCCPLLERRIDVSSGLRRESCRLTVMVTAAERRRRSGLSRGGVKPWPRPSSRSLGLKWPVTGGELRSITPPFPWLSLERQRGRRNKPSVRFLLWLSTGSVNSINSGRMKQIIFSNYWTTCYLPFGEPASSSLLVPKLLSCYF